MSHRQRVVDLVSNLAAPVALDLGLELVEVEYLREGDRDILRITIDRDGALTHDDCQALSNAVSDKLDELDPIPEAYDLEVSSPGVERPLKKDSDFTRFTGREVALHLFAAQAGRKSWQGVLRGLDGGEVVLETDTGSQRFPRQQISRAHLVFHFN
ncbi:MAG: ribosome maturation factor RimP [Symbiobacteriia bacterium]